MKTSSTAFVAISIVAAATAGFFLGRSGATPDMSASSSSGEREIDYWVAPMDANYRRDEPGKSPMGMDLVPVYKDDGTAKEDGTVIISPSTMNNIGVRTRPVERADLGYEIRTVGFVGYDETRVSHVHMRAKGWIEELAVQAEGERVKKGDLLFRIYAPDLVVAQSDYLQALRSGNKDHIALAAERLVLLGFEDSQVATLKKERKLNQRVDILARQDGVVVDLDVAENMYVTPDTAILTIADLSTVWVLADVFEDQSAWLKPDLPATVSLSYETGMPLEGTVDYVYPIVDPQTRTMKVRLRFDNAGERLKPNMYTDVVIQGEEKPDVLTIPRDALIRTGQSARVVLASGEGRFAPREVRTGRISGERVEIISGLEENDEVVVSAHFLIDSEASLSAGFRRMSDGASEAMVIEADMEMDMDMDMDMDGAEETVGGMGKLNAIMADERTINLTHEPIAKIGWPAMTMDFKVDASVDLSRLQVGDTLHFEMERQGGGSYIITVIHVLSTP